LKTTITYLTNDQVWNQVEEDVAETLSFEGWQAIELQVWQPVGDIVLDQVRRQIYLDAYLKIENERTTN